MCMCVCLCLRLCVYAYVYVWVFCVYVRRLDTHGMAKIRGDGRSPHHLSALLFKALLSSTNNATIEQHRRSTVKETATKPTVSSSQQRSAAQATVRARLYAQRTTREFRRLRDGTVTTQQHSKLSLLLQCGPGGLFCNL